MDVQYQDGTVASSATHLLLLAGLPSQFECLHHRKHFGWFENDFGTALLAPGVIEDNEHVGVVCYHFGLLSGAKFDHAPGFVFAQAGEYLAAYPEVGMLHVRSFHHIGQTQGKFSKLLARHCLIVIVTLVLAMCMLFIFRRMGIVEDTLNGETPCIKDNGQ